MSVRDIAQDLTVYNHARTVGLTLDAVTGLPKRLIACDGGQERTIALALTVQLVTEGREVPVDPFGLAYEDTLLLEDCRLDPTPPLVVADGPDEIVTITSIMGPWTVDWHYTFRPSHPRLSAAFTIRSTGQTPATLRDVHLTFTFRPDDLTSWSIEAPGNQVRPHVRADLLHDPIAVSSAGGVSGSTGLIALHDDAVPCTVVLWPFVRTEIGRCQLQKQDQSIEFALRTGLAGRLSSGQALQYGAIGLDVMASTWGQVRATVPAWYRSFGLSTPHDRSEWIEAANVFEVQIGFSVFWGGYRYAPYPTVKDLHADLGRIRGLGYTVVQIMPRQPYPSYNVHDYADISTSYGDEQDLRALVASCHALGMHVILDILMHGVIDKTILARTADRVRSSVYFARLSQGTINTFDESAGGAEGYEIAWRRHILDFEPFWSTGSPERHPLVVAHPDWFMRDSEQNIIGIYTNAFDVANEAWQEYFCQAAEELVRRLDIDGFRFDAPTYNDLPNWSTTTQQRASYSPLGSLELFDRLRARLKRLKQSIMLYTEPSGALFRQAMDVTYNYDEQWLINAVLMPSSDKRRQETVVRHARDLAAWFQERNDVLPGGSVTAHHIDSHDTFWWPLPGAKWRREQYGLPATRALLAVFALSGGAFMTFVGGEEGLQEEIRRVNHLRSSQPEIGHGIVDYASVTLDDDAIYGVVRHLHGACTVVLVNLSDDAHEVSCTLHSSTLELDAPAYEVYDLWNDQTLAVEGRYDVPVHALTLLPLSFQPFQIRVLNLRSIAGHP